MAVNYQQDTRPEILSLSQNLGLGTRAKMMASYPTQLGTEVPMIGEMSYQNYATNRETPGSGPLDQVKNRIARSRKGGQKQLGFGNGI